MGNYNPNAPVILGQEWAAIRNEDAIFSPAVNSVELGHGFVLPAARQVTNARFYINKLQPLSDRGQTFMAAVYPAGTENQSGPVSSVVIPADAVAVSGGTVSSGATNAVDALLTQSTSTGISLDCSQPLVGLNLSFAVSGALVLTGKRILGVNLLTGTQASSDITGPLRNNNTSLISVSPDPTFNFIGNPQAIFGRLRVDTDIQRSAFGEINQFWTANSPNATADRVPWTYAQLTRLDAVATKLFTKIETGTIRGTTANSSCYIFYAALEVIYCEEKRLIVGATQFGTSASSTSGTQSVLGANQIIMHDIATSALTPVLPAGSYTLVLSSADVGGLNDNQVQLTSAYPNLNAVRELYTIPTHPGIETDLPFPLIDHIGSVFTTKFTHVLPQLSLHASGGTLTEPHVYGRRVAAQVYGAQTATQEIYDDIVGANTVYQQVRFYARRFGETSTSLTLTGTASLAGSSVSIAPADFDALVEILDGIREVTLRFATPPTMGTLVSPEPSWTWSAVGETSGNRWEIIGAAAPAISGIGSNLFNPIPAPNQLGAATYQPPPGDTVELTWMPQGVTSPFVTSPSTDAGTDAFLVFSQDPPTITGVSLTGQTQAVTGFALDCGALPCCIPTGISYQQVNWSLPTNTGAGFDTFSRVVVADWGTATNGQVWQNMAGADDSVNGVAGIVAATTSGDRDGWIAIGGPDQDVQATISIASGAPATFRHRAGVTARLTNASNRYSAEMWYQTAGTVDLFIRKRVAGVSTDLITMTIQGMLPSPTAQRRIRFQVYGNTLSAKLWNVGDAEPTAWQLTTTDSALTTGNNAGIFGRNDVVGTPVTAYSWRNFAVKPPQVLVNAYELQRFDSVSAQFQTIMLAMDTTRITFNDFESRVGLNSVYRIRALNALNFAGAWSTQVTGSVPSPGITGGCMGDDGSGALIFTSNADQTGANNAAYVMQWDGAPSEDFKLAEADMVQYQPIYNRDGSIAFHGTERGLESFERTVLLAAAAISPVRLADAKTIRDLAWAALPYVCVRDEIGDRWLASVRVPAVNSRFNRTKYFARLEVVEVTQTSAAVNP